MASMAAQKSICKKLSESIVNNEYVILNQRFTFYKMMSKDTVGNMFVPPRGTRFEILNRNLLHDAVD